ncbi:hypothetical protein pdam_00025156, partial [Pocillopora damicornis]
FGFVDDVCNGKDDPCTLKCNEQNTACEQNCNVGNYTCKLDCSVDHCDQKCNSRICFLNCTKRECKQSCSRRVRICQMECTGQTCNQACNARKCILKRSHSLTSVYGHQACNGGVQTCNLKCSGEECNQNCNGGAQRCIMQCMGSSCTQTCDAHTCDMIRNGSSNYYTKQICKSGHGPCCQRILMNESLGSFETTCQGREQCTCPECLNRDCMTLNKSDVTAAVLASTVQAISTHISTVQDFADQYQNITKSHGSQLGIEELQRGKESVFKVAVALEKFVLDYSQYHLNRAEPLKKITRQKMVLGMWKGYRQNATDFYLEENEWHASINVPSENFAENGSVVIGCVYKDLHELLQTNQGGGDKTENSRWLLAQNGLYRYVNTRIMTAAVDPKPEKLRQDVILKFRNLKVDEGEKQCMFWNGLGKSFDGFSGDGCYVDPLRSNSKDTVCRCNHLTHFAVLVDFRGDAELSKKDVTILEIITYVGLSLSIVGILLTITLYSFLTDVRQPLPQIRLSLCVSLGAGQIIFLSGINATEKMTACITSAVLMQYFLMAAFCWMLVEGIYLYLLVVKVYNISDKMYIYHVMSWGLPVIVVAISLSIAAGAADGIQSYISDDYCWMSSTNNLIWIFVTFMVIVEVINILILTRVIREMTKMQPRGGKQIQQIRLGIRTCVVMTPLLGVTWLFGLLSPAHKTFAYIFTILNSTQMTSATGFLIFILHCVRNGQIKERFNRKMSIIFPSENIGNSTKKSS